MRRGTATRPDARRSRRPPPPAQACLSSSRHAPIGQSRNTSMSIVILGFAIGQHPLRPDRLSSLRPDAAWLTAAAGHGLSINGANLPPGRSDAAAGEAWNDWIASAAKRREAATREAVEVARMPP